MSMLLKPLHSGTAANIKNKHKMFVWLTLLQINWIEIIPNMISQLRLHINSMGITSLICQQTFPDSTVHGANMGPIWALSAPDGPHLGPMNLTIRVVFYHTTSGPLFTDRRDVLTAKSREDSKQRDWIYNDWSALTFDRLLDSAAAEVPVKFQNNWKSLKPNLAAPRFHEILRDRPSA